ncbi:GNAT family N-acetyltransferase [Candidatus Protochlamydia amoebophila]|uniref:N-acetyltransferase domain-containing protein n=1 Tax=Protochlamydia amoebophila (strain UWE25) TaxID=264201 RepID=Q6MAV6_PARUW|nr:GNAT family N-acetyltransferase [Candidatus Protochlamydia amoebophila]CAF24293.1 unnamed protein product [Candidatus Protochlamydia amoebophila UWE25]
MKPLYSLLESQIFNHYQLVAIRQQDMEQIRLWRNEQIDILRQQKPISKEDQIIYFEKFIKPLFDLYQPNQILFSYLYQGQCIGYGGLVNVDWQSKKGELSFLVKTERASFETIYIQDFLHFLTLISQFAFKKLNFHRIYTETFAFRLIHMQVLENFGFKKEGILREHIYKKQRWIDSLMHGLLAHEVIHE